jgi:MarR family transcriptional regulator, organic hydroperoxide resistance regulator
MNKNENTFSYKSENESSGFLLWQLNNIWQRQIIKSLKEFNLTHVQFVILTSLYWLETHNEKTTQISIAKFAHADVMMTSKVLRTLEEKKLIKRTDDKVDTRAKVIKITEK